MGQLSSASYRGKLDLLEIKCHRCERHGRVSLARLIDEHGADIGLPDLWEVSRVTALTRGPRR